LLKVLVATIALYIYCCFPSGLHAWSFILLTVTDRRFDLLDMKGYPYIWNYDGNEGLWKLSAGKARQLDNWSAFNLQCAEHYFYQFLMDFCVSNSHFIKKAPDLDVLVLD